MDHKQVPRIILRGDREEASYRAREGIRQLDILKTLMEFQGLKQDVRRIRYLNGSEITCRSVFGTEDINIYVPERKKEAREEVIGRFFAKVRRGGLYGKDFFYWVKIIEENKVIVWSMQAEYKRTADSMSNLPAEMKHAATKSFMLTKKVEEEGEEEIEVEERWVAAQHLLVKDCIQRFNPLGYPSKAVLWPGGLAYYPLPPACVTEALPGHPCPPNRFYCNIEEKIMVWYSCYTVLDIYPPYALLHYCFGAVLKITDSMIEETYQNPYGEEYYTLVDSETGEELIKTFNCYSSEVDDEGFDPYWYTEKLDPVCPGDPMCGADEEVPYQMLTDVDSLDKEKIEIFLPWSARPIKFTVDLTGPNVFTTEQNHTYEAVTSADHWFWTKDGFEQKLFAEFDQNFNDDLSDYDSDSGIGSSSDCSGESEESCIPGCPGSGIGNLRNHNWYRWRSINYGPQDRHSWYRINIFDEEEFTESFWLLGRTIEEYRYANASYCRWDSYLHSCSGPFTSGWQARRWMVEHTMQKVVNSVNAEWSSPNIAFVGQEINRIFADNEARQYPLIPHSWAWNCDDAPACMNMCACGNTPFSCGSGSLGGAECFIGYPFELAEPDNFTPHWGATPTHEEFYTALDGCEQKRWLDKNDLNKPLVLEFRVDGGIKYSSRDYNRTYYLDDRSSENSEGLLVGARGAIVKGYNYGGSPIFDVARWSIVYKNIDEEVSVDVTSSILEALNCETSELIEIGLM